MKHHGPGTSLKPSRESARHRDRSASRAAVHTVAAVTSAEPAPGWALGINDAGQLTATSPDGTTTRIVETREETA